MGLHIFEKNLMEFISIVHCNKTVVDYIPKFTKSVETKLCLFSSKHYKRKWENMGLQTKKLIYMHYWYLLAVSLFRT